MELDNLSACEQNCNKKCYVELKDGTLDGNMTPVEIDESRIIELLPEN